MRNTGAAQRRGASVRHCRYLPRSFYTSTMPKTLVLFHGSSDAVATMADATADGVRSVRFAEVDVRRLMIGTAAASCRHRTLSSADELAGYDGLVLVAGGGPVPVEVTRLIGAAADLRLGGTVTLTVGSAFVAEASGVEGDDARWALLRALATLGVVLVPASGEGVDGAKKLGHRVAHVVSWITHAKSHHH